jgi:hypothetical protein
MNKKISDNESYKKLREEMPGFVTFSNLYRLQNYLGSKIKN